METTFIVRIILIIISSLSMVLQIIGLTGRAWFGFSISMNITGVKIHEHVEGGLFHISPMEVCVDPGNGTVCKTPEDFPPNTRQLFDVGMNALHESVTVLRFLTITGVLLSGGGLIVLYIYLCTKSNRHRCKGIISAVAWMSSGLSELVATGIQLSKNNDTKNGLRLVGVIFEQKGIQMQGNVITAWATIIIGIGAATAIIVGTIVAITTCGKKFNKTVILYSELQEKDKTRLMFDQDDDDD